VLTLPCHLNESDASLHHNHNDVPSPARTAKMAIFTKNSGSCEILKITSNTLYIQKKNMQTVMAAAIYKKNSYNLFVHNSVPTFS